MGKFVDLTGHRFGRLTVLERAPSRTTKSGRHITMWKCRCDCGNEIVTRDSLLKTGHTTSCGCAREGCRRENLIGQKFGKLTVTELTPTHIQPNGNHVTMWKCKCDCGNETIVSAGALKSGGVISCGCAKNGCQIEDLTGQRFGKLTVIERAKSGKTPSGRSVTKWLCKCDCGNTKIVDAMSLKSGATKSCGCLVHQHHGEDLTGKKFNLLTVIKKAPSKRIDENRTLSMWECQCDCGNPKHVIVSEIDLLHGHIKSCGCLQYQKANHSTEWIKMHGVWSAMKQRCTNPNNKDYEDYGARGITVCQRWMDSFDTFLEDMGDSYQIGLEIDRRDNSKGYYKENCKWVTRSENMRNTRRNHIVDSPWGKMCAQEFCEELAKHVRASPKTIRGYIDQGKTVEEILKSTKYKEIDNGIQETTD